jgi:uncharacterized protein involved in exopolysaccharide biosynthesis
VKGPFSAGEIDVLQLVRVIWKRRGVFLSVIAIFVFLMIVCLHLLPKSYTVTAEIAPVVSSNQQVSGGLSALASLGGVNLSDLSGGGGQFRLFVSGLNSRDVADLLAQDQSLMRELFPEEWSGKDHGWREPSGMIRSVVRGMAGLVGYPVRMWKPPGGERLYDLLNDDLEISDNPKNPVIALRMQSIKPEVTMEFMGKLIQAVDLLLRKRALTRANDYIAYLNTQLENVTVTDYRAALINRLSEQQQIRMMASANVSFAAQVFSAPYSSTKPTAPKSILLLLFSIILGIFTGGAAAIVAERRRWVAPRFLQNAAAIYTVWR